jgi:hypothetical protein
MSPHALLLLVPGLLGQPAHETPMDPLASRVELTAALGVAMFAAPDVIDWINSTALTGNRVDLFNSAVEFTGAAAMPVGGPWRVKAEYVYMLSSFSVNGGFGAATFSLVAHMPSLLLEYTLADEGLYCVKLDGGLGYHFGHVDEKYLTIDRRYSSSGVGGILALVGNTALSEHLHAYLAVSARWEGFGDLQDAGGAAPGGVALGTPPTMSLFAASARIGLSHYF